MFTVLGAGGFIGSHLMRHLSAAGAECFAPARADPAILQRDLGHVIFCIGVTADFRGRPLDTMEAHVCKLVQLLRHGRFESLLYLSSTRVYQGAARADEPARIAVDPSSPSDLYNLSKLAGEAVCLSQDRPTLRVARLSNVYGTHDESDNFLASVVRDAALAGRVMLRTAPESEKDYVNVDDVAEALIRIAGSGRSRVYNVAGGENVANAAILERLRTLTGCVVEVQPEAPVVRFPPISIARMQAEFDYRPRRLLESLDGLVNAYRAGGARRDHH